MLPFHMFQYIAGRCECGLQQCAFGATHATTGIGNIVCRFSRLFSFSIIIYSFDIPLVVTILPNQHLPHDDTVFFTRNNFKIVTIVNMWTLQCVWRFRLTVRRYLWNIFRLGIGRHLIFRLIFRLLFGFFFLLFLGAICLRYAKYTMYSHSRL